MLKIILRLLGSVFRSRRSLTRENHAKAIASIDFFTVPTATFRVLYVFLVLSHDRRRILHFNVAASRIA